MQLSQPEYGGATVFPYLNVAINATKVRDLKIFSASLTSAQARRICYTGGTYMFQGDAIFWYNLLKSGADDKNSIHAGCPVASGVKWIANQWIKEGGQEFIRPCGLKEDV